MSTTTKLLDGLLATVALGAGIVAYLTVGETGSAGAQVSTATAQRGSAHSGVRVGTCAFVRGTSRDKGVNVGAQTINLVTPGPGGCTVMFRRP